MNKDGTVAFPQTASSHCLSFHSQGDMKDNESPLHAECLHQAAAVIRAPSETVEEELWRGVDCRDPGFSPLSISHSWGQQVQGLSPRRVTDAGRRSMNRLNFHPYERQTHLTTVNTGCIWTELVILVRNNVGLRPSEEEDDPVFSCPLAAWYLQVLVPRTHWSWVSWNDSSNPSSNQPHLPSQQRHPRLLPGTPLLSFPHSQTRPA